MVHREKVQGDAKTTAIARLEQLYPRPTDEVIAELRRYPNLRDVRWVQDEPANMGPAPHMRLNLFPELDRPVQVISRDASSSPAVGQAAWWIEPSCHHDQTSSVAKGMIGASSRSSVCSPRPSAARADAAASSPCAPYARSLTSSRKSSQKAQKNVSVNSSERV